MFLKKFSKPFRNGGDENMQLLKVLKSLFLGVGVALAYIHMQMQIFDLGYQGKKKEQAIVELTEKNGVLSYNILRLTSANHLGTNLLSGDSSLIFRDRNNVVQLVTAESIRDEKEIASGKESKKANSLLSFLPIRSATEAQAEERKDSEAFSWDSSR